MTNNLHSGHRKRLRARFDRTGMSGWSEHEALEYMLFYIFKRCDTNELAHRIINEAGSLDAALAMNHDMIKSIPGAGEKTAYYLRALGEFVRYINNRPVSGLRLNKANTQRYVMKLFDAVKHEAFYIIMLDKSMRVIDTELLFEGDFSRINIDIKQISAKILKSEAAYVIAAHNHPSGVLAPSESDIQTTRIMSETMELFGSRLLEHYIVSGTECLGIIETMNLKKNRGGK